MNPPIGAYGGMPAEAGTMPTGGSESRKTTNPGEGSMRVVITDLVTGTCDLTGKSDTECVKMSFDDATPEVVCVPAELIKLLRLRKKQDGNKPPEKKGL
jgi:hypothetical protein